jgi:hypothetical protein
LGAWGWHWSLHASLKKESVLIKECPCKKCKLFNNKEGEGWEDTGNGFYIVHCKDGKSRPTLSFEQGCPDQEEITREYIQ